MADLRCDIIDINPTTVALTGDSTALVRHHSTAKVSMYAASDGGASVNLDTCIIKNGSKRVLGMEATFECVESDVFELSAEDSEGHYVRKTVSWRMVDYIKLTCNNASSRPDASGEADLKCVGDYFNGSFGAVSNTLTVRYRYRVAGGSWSGYNSMTVSKTGNAYAASASLSGLNYEATYEFEFLAQDALMTASSSSGNVTTLPVFHWGENDVTFEVPVNFNKGIENARVTDNLYLGEDDDCFLRSVYGTLYIQSDNFVYNNKVVSFSQSGTWTPSLSCSGVYWSQSGWYSKTGNVVTVGFHIKMYTDSIYDNYDVVIQGLPFIPSVAAAGGGMCSGALMTGSKNFQCFVAGTDGNITTRVQACDDTFGNLLETSASGCKYSSAGELTLSGTITYMTN